MFQIWKKAERRRWGGRGRGGGGVGWRGEQQNGRDRTIGASLLQQEENS